MNDDNVGWGVYVGNRLTDFVRIEFETMYSGIDDTKRNLDFNFDIWANMVNMYLYRTYGNVVEP